MPCLCGCAECECGEICFCSVLCLCIRCHYTRDNPPSNRASSNSSQKAKDIEGTSLASKSLKTYSGHQSLTSQIDKVIPKFTGKSQGKPSPIRKLLENLSASYVKKNSFLHSSVIKTDSASGQCIDNVLRRRRPLSSPSRIAPQKDVKTDHPVVTSSPIESFSRRLHDSPNKIPRKHLLQTDPSTAASFREESASSSSPQSPRKVPKKLSKNDSPITQLESFSKTLHCLSASMTPQKDFIRSNKKIPPNERSPSRTIYLSPNKMPKMHLFQNDPSSATLIEESSGETPLDLSKSPSRKQLLRSDHLTVMSPRKRSPERAFNSHLMAPQKQYFQKDPESTSLHLQSNITPDKRIRQTNPSLAISVDHKSCSSTNDSPLNSTREMLQTALIVDSTSNSRTTSTASLDVADISTSLLNMLPRTTSVVDVRRVSTLASRATPRLSIPRSVLNFYCAENFRPTIHARMIEKNTIYRPLPRRPQLFTHPFTGLMPSLPVLQGARLSAPRIVNVASMFPRNEDYNSSLLNLERVTPPIYSSDLLKSSVYRLDNSRRSTPQAENEPSKQEQPKLPESSYRGSLSSASAVQRVGSSIPQEDSYSSLPELEPIFSPAFAWPRYSVHHPECSETSAPNQEQSKSSVNHLKGSLTSAPVIQRVESSILKDKLSYSPLTDTENFPPQNVFEKPKYSMHHLECSGTSESKLKQLNSSVSQYRDSVSLGSAAPKFGSSMPENEDSFSFLDLEPIPIPSASVEWPAEFFRTSALRHEQPKPSVTQLQGSFSSAPVVQRFGSSAPENEDFFSSLRDLELVPIQSSSVKWSESSVHHTEYSKISALRHEQLKSSVTQLRGSFSSAPVVERVRFSIPENEDFFSSLLDLEPVPIPSASVEWPTEFSRTSALRHEQPKSSVTQLRGSFSAAPVVEHFGSSIPENDDSFSSLPDLEPVPIPSASVEWPTEFSRTSALRHEQPKSSVTQLRGSFSATPVVEHFGSSIPENVDSFSSPPDLEPGSIPSASVEWSKSSVHHTEYSRISALRYEQPKSSVTQIRGSFSSAPVVQRVGSCLPENEDSFSSLPDLEPVPIPVVSVEIPKSSVHQFEDEQMSASQFQRDSSPCQFLDSNIPGFQRQEPRSLISHFESERTRKCTDVKQYIRESVNLPSQSRVQDITSTSRHSLNTAASRHQRESDSLQFYPQEKTLRSVCNISEESKQLQPSELSDSSDAFTVNVQLKIDPSRKERRVSVSNVWVEQSPLESQTEEISQMTPTNTQEEPGPSHLQPRESSSASESIIVRLHYVVPPESESRDNFQIKLSHFEVEENPLQSRNQEEFHESLSLIQAERDSCQFQPQYKPHELLSHVQVKVDILQSRDESRPSHRDEPSPRITLLDEHNVSISEDYEEPHTKQIYLQEQYRPSTSIIQMKIDPPQIEPKEEPCESHHIQMKLDVQQSHEEEHHSSISDFKAKLDPLQSPSREKPNPMLSNTEGKPVPSQSKTEGKPVPSQSKPEEKPVLSQSKPEKKPYTTLSNIEVKPELPHPEKPQTSISYVKLKLDPLQFNSKEEAHASLSDFQVKPNFFQSIQKGETQTSNSHVHVKPDLLQPHQEVKSPTSPYHVHVETDLSQSLNQKDPRASIFHIQVKPYSLRSQDEEKTQEPISHVQLKQEPLQSKVGRETQASISHVQVKQEPLQSEYEGETRASMSHVQVKQGPLQFEEETQAPISNVQVKQEPLRSEDEEEMPASIFHLEGKQDPLQSRDQEEPRIFPHVDVKPDLLQSQDQEKPCSSTTNVEMEPNSLQSRNQAEPQA